MKCNMYIVYRNYKSKHNIKCINCLQKTCIHFVQLISYNPITGCILPCITTAVVNNFIKKLPTFFSESLYFFPVTS